MSLSLLLRVEGSSGSSQDPLFLFPRVMSVSGQPGSCDDWKAGTNMAGIGDVTCSASCAQGKGEELLSIVTGDASGMGGHSYEGGRCYLNSIDIQLKE